MRSAAISRGLKAAALASAAIALTACGVEPIAHNDSDYPTFVSLNPCLDAILVEVADPEQILALSHYSRDPAASSMDVERARTFGITGGTAEEVLGLQPDIVLASSFIAPSTKAALERAGLRVETFGSPSSSEQSYDQIQRLSGLAEQAGKGERLIEHIQTRDQRPQGSAGSAMVWQPGQIVAGESSLVAEHLEWAGFASQSAAKGLGQGDHGSLESLLVDPPDLLLIAGDAPGQEHPVLSELTHTHIARFEPNLFYCAGPSILAARARLIRIRGEMEVAAQ